MRKKRLPRIYLKYMERLVSNNTVCSYCNNKAQTIHHKDENRDNNTISNLLPLCHECHEEIPHTKRSVCEY